MGCQASVTAQTKETAPWTHTFKDLSNLSSLECSRTTDHKIVINDSKGSMEEFIKMLQKNHGLTELVMADCKLNESEIEQVTKAMNASKCPLLKLDLSSNQFGVKGAMFLPPLLATKKSLETLRLAGIALNTMTIHAILQALDTHNPALTSLYIDNCTQEDTALLVNTLVYMIQKGGSQLRELSVSHITTDFVQALCEAISTANRPMHFLQFSNVFDLPETPGHSLKFSTSVSIDHLSLINNHLTDESIRHLVEQWQVDKPTIKAVTIEPGNPLVTSVGRKLLDDYLEYCLEEDASSYASSAESTKDDEKVKRFWSMESLVWK